MTMKKLTFLLTITALVFCAPQLHAAPQSADDENSTRLNLWIPGFVVRMAAELAEDHAQPVDADAINMLHAMGSMTVCIREGAYYKEKTDAKLTRKLARIEKRDFEELISVYDEGTKVNISTRSKQNGKIKRLVVMVDEPGETYVFVKLHCNLSPQDIPAMTKQFRNI